MWLVLLFALASHRIVSTAPSITEILFALGAGDQVVGDTLYCNYPEAAKSKPKIGGFKTPNIELILALNPDLVFVNDSQTNVVAALRQTGRIDVITLHPDSVSGIYRSIRIVAEKIDRKSTRLNSSHTVISYAVFCLKKKKHTPPEIRTAG